MEIMIISLSSQGITIQIGAIGLLIIFLFVILIWIIRNQVFNRYKLEETEIGWGGLKYKIKPSFEDLQVAYKLWVEMSTRKLGIEIDSENDLINKLHESYYEFFKISREILKEVPAEKISNKETQKIIKLILKIINDELRPYLTKWHARFNTWYKNNIEKEEYRGYEPTEIQRKFPQYQELMGEIFEVNKKMIQLRKTLGNLIGIKE
jgi:hypothetical protein